MASRPYAGEEVLTFDRIKRAVTSRVIEAAEQALERGNPLDKQRLAALATEEWKSVKVAVKNSPTAREKARERMRAIVSSMLENHVSSDKGELENLGVQERSL
ncbi:MAG: hypothetical protein Q7T05_00265 [Dehalococcoidia bacterium]|nr:hypothetical protein [Dehalococcoidia bacterium]